MKRILIIDDDADFAEALITLLSAQGYAVEAAASGGEGVSRAKSWAPQLIILDVMMSHQTEGYEVARYLRDHAKTGAIPVILVTGVRDELHLDMKLEPDDDWLPVKAVLEKPIKPEQLLKCVQENIGA
ncbi:MAG: response regulator [Candidatus Omnitrophica bacterium]|nr:response regulator [Candidatus Omnitrophota bacterium]